ncbi:serine hydrolase domain-containing protein [Vibrio fluminensis]|uniref:serine hydrolase domain-containing protein n=1 Tax=Vibrio fluminensis TaxID=2783614 RepID=UPI0018891DD2|nr:serine hydrolase domain-containing protein [Vibrio fluminensis]
MNLYSTVLIAGCVVMSNASIANDENLVSKALKVDGALVTLPIEAAKLPYSNEFIAEARQNFNNFHWQMGGDHSLYYNMHMNEFMQTALASPSHTYKPLVKEIDNRLDNMLVKTSARGEITMQEYLTDPQFRTQGFLLLHKGKIVYQAYPGMKPTDRHIWASSSKTMVGVVVAMLVEEGKISEAVSVTDYIPQLRNTVWDSVTVMDLLNHTTGLANEETAQSIMKPNSPVVRFFASAIGSENHDTQSQDSWMDVARDTQKIEGEKAGERFRYASMNTMLLTQIVENIEGTTWTKVFEERVWSHVNARQPMLFNLTPEGSAIALGLVSSTLEDMARWGALFTPSWQAVADKPVISPALIDHIRVKGNPKAFEGSAKQASSMHAFNEKADYHAYQFDYVFSDGAMAKSGNLGQFIYIDPDRDFVGVAFSTNPYHSGFGESKAPALMRQAAKVLAGQ